MSQWNYPGAKWWKFDFHTHTRASTDFMKGCSGEEKAKITPEIWLRNFMEKGIDCVAITDHNSGGWIDKLKNALEQLGSNGNKPDWYRSITLFPGVEISAHGGVHILAIFGIDKSQSDIDSLLGEIGYHGTKGNSDDVTDKTTSTVIDIIAKYGGIAIPAHIDKGKGLFEQEGNTLEQALKNTNIHAIELYADAYQKPQLYLDRKLQWTEVKGSDTHNFGEGRFGEFTWVKMDTPSLEGLKLALIDGTASVNRDMGDNPNQHAEYVIEELIVDTAKFIGCPQALNCQFSPFLNTIIGGRGSGKSTLLEFMRFVLRRNNEIPEPLQLESNKYFPYSKGSRDENLLTDKSVLRLIYRKNHTRYRLNWSAEATINSLEVDDNGNWQAENGEIQTLFPVHIYSQKQIFELSKNPEALLEMIDKDASVAHENFIRQKQTLTNQYKQILQKQRELKDKISQKNRLHGELSDLNRQIEQIEKSGHKSVMRNFRDRQQQLNIIKNIENDWQEMVVSLINIKESIAPVDFNDRAFNEHIDILSALKTSNEKWADIGKNVEILEKEAQSIITNWQKEKDQTKWMKELKGEISKYEQVKSQLEQQGIDPDKYPSLLQRQAQTKKELLQIENYTKQVDLLNEKKGETFAAIKENREQLTKNRQLFLETILKGNQAVSMKIQPFKEKADSVKKSLQSILHCDGRYEKDINALMDEYQKANNFEELKSNVKKISLGKKDAKDSRFCEHLKGLTQESMIDFGLWFPEDDLKITFGKDNQKIESGSAGQKCAALLAFILSYGEEPLLLDQPEDDLDNELIYELIVKQIRATKSKRQIIIITHNANIVVNGDAEMVFPLSVANGQSTINPAASIQDRQVRKKICTILEGGQYAFSQRYKRIHLES